MAAFHVMVKQFQKSQGFSPCTGLLCQQTRSRLEKLAAEQGIGLRGGPSVSNALQSVKNRIEDLLPGSAAQKRDRQFVEEAEIAVGGGATRSGKDRLRRRGTVIKEDLHGLDFFMEIMNVISEVPERDNRRESRLNIRNRKSPMRSSSKVLPLAQSSDVAEIVNLQSEDKSFARRGSTDFRDSVPVVSGLRRRTSSPKKGLLNVPTNSLSVDLVESDLKAANLVNPLLATSSSKDNYSRSSSSSPGTAAAAQGSSKSARLGSTRIIQGLKDSTSKIVETSKVNHCFNLSSLILTKLF